jgi:hypothetical protein
MSEAPLYSYLLSSELRTFVRQSRPVIRQSTPDLDRGNKTVKARFWPWR